MFHYFRNYSSNTHHVCCEDSPNKGLHMTIASPMTLTVIQDETGLLFNLQYLGQYVSYYIQMWHDGRLMDALYAHASFDDLDARSQWVGKVQKSALHALDN